MTSYIEWNLLLLEEYFSPSNAFQDVWRGLELRFARQEFIEPHVEHCDHYSKGVTSGKVDVRELDDWVGDIVRLEGSVAFMQVCLYEFKWSRRRMDELVVTDVSTTPGCMLLRVDMQKKAGRRKRKNDSADSGSDFDWLEAPKPDLPAEEASNNNKTKSNDSDKNNDNNNSSGGS